MRKNKTKFRKIIFASAAGLALVCLAAGAYMLWFAIARKGPAREAAAVTADPLAAESRTAGLAWMRAFPLETLTINAADGTPLVGYYMEAAKFGNRADAGKKLAVTVHGYGTNAFLMADYARFYLEAGFDVFAPDLRAHGASGGELIGMGFLDSADLLLWLDALAQKTGDAPVVLHGVSMGASTALMASNRLPPRVKCVVSDCGYTSAFAEFKYQLKEMFGLPPFPLLYLASAGAKLTAGYYFSEADAPAAVTKTRAPILFIHGDADDFVPTDMARELYRATAGKKELWLAPGAAHAMAYYADPANYKRRVLKFCADCGL